MKDSGILDFNNSNFFIGLDVHKKDWCVTIRSNGMELKKFSMNPSSDELWRYLIKNYPGGNYLAAYEAGFCGFTHCRRMNELGIKCIVVNASDIPTGQFERVQKTDPRDSRKIARELENNSLKSIYLPARDFEELRSLVRLRHKLTKHQTMIKNRIKGTLYYYGINIPLRFQTNTRWSMKFIQWLNEIKLTTEAGNFTLQENIRTLIEVRTHIKDILLKIREELKKEEHAKYVEALISVPGIAFLSAAVIYTEIMDIKRFGNFDELANYAGLIPALHSSGETEYTKGITKRRNGYLRGALTECAWMAVRKDPALTLKFSELTKRMNKQKAIIRIAKKLLSRIRYVWFNKCEYVYSLVS